MIESAPQLGGISQRAAFDSLDDSRRSSKDVIFALPGDYCPGAVRVTSPSGRQCSSVIDDTRGDDLFTPKGGRAIDSMFQRSTHPFGSPVTSLPAVFVVDPSSQPQEEAVHGGGEERDSSASPTVRRPQVPSAWLAVAALSMIYFIHSGVDNATSAAMFSKMREDFDASNFQLALTQRMSEAAKIAGSAVLGHFGVHTRPVWVCIFCVVFSVGCSVVSASPTLYLSGIGYFGIGLGYAATIVLTPPIMDEVTMDKPRVSFFLSIIMALAALGVVFYFVLAGIPGSPDKWRLHYALSAAACFIPCGMLAWTQRKFCTCALPGILCGPRAHRPPFFATMCELLGDKRTVLLVIAQTFASFYLSALAVFIPQYVEQNFSVSEEKAAFVMAIAFPGSLIGIFLGGYIVKHFRMGRYEQLLLILVGSILPIPILATIWYVKSLVAFTALLIVAMFIGFVPLSPGYSLLALLQTSPEDVSYANSLTQFVSRLLGGIPGPILLGVMLDHNGEFLTRQTSYLIISMFGACGAAVALSVLVFSEGLRRRVKPGAASSEPPVNPPSNVAASE